MRVIFAALVCIAAVARGCQFARTWCARNARPYQTGSVGATNVATCSPGSNLRNNVISPAGVLAGTATLPAALNYSFGFLDERLRYEQTVVGYNTSGNIFDGIGAGPFSMAAGVEWRQEIGHDDEVSCPANDAACQARIQDFAAQFGDRARAHADFSPGTASWLFERSRPG